VVEFRPEEGRLNFVDAAGRVFNTYELYDPRSVDYDREVRWAGGSYRNGRHCGFSQDGSLFAFVYAIKGRPEPYVRLLVFKNGQLQRETPLPLGVALDDLMLSPDGSRLFVAAHGLGPGRFRGVVPGIMGAVALFLDIEGNVLQQWEALFWGACFSQTGRYLAVLDFGKQARILRTADGAVMGEITEPMVRQVAGPVSPDALDQTRRQIVGLALEENREIACLITGSGYVQNMDDRLDLTFTDFQGNILQNVTINHPGQRMIGSSHYEFRFSADGHKWAFTHQSRLVKGELTAQK
jgi:hypothetical protein